MEKKMELNISEQQLVCDQLTTQVEMLWDVYDSPEHLVQEDMMDTFIGCCRLVERFETDLGWKLPETKIFQQGMEYYRKNWK